MEQNLASRKKYSSVAAVSLTSFALPKTRLSPRLKVNGALRRGLLGVALLSGLLSSSAVAHKSRHALSPTLGSPTPGGPTLGGPRVSEVDARHAIQLRPINSTTNTASNVVPSNFVDGSHDSGDTHRPAQPSASPGLSDKEGNAAPSSQPLPIDLGAIRRLKVANELIGDTPLRVANLDVLAPIVPELQRIGAYASHASLRNLPGNPNTPTQDKFFQINLPNSPPIVLTVGKETAYINNVPQQLRAAPLVIKDKIWLPIFSLAPLLGAATRLEPDGTLHLNPTVQSVELFPVKDTVALTIKTSAPIQPGQVLMGTMDDPPKLYLDFTGYSMGFDAGNSSYERVVSKGLGTVQRVRAGIFQSFPDITRVVLDLKGGMKGVAQPMPDKTLFAFILVPPGGSAPPPATPPTTPVMSAAPTGPNSLRGLTIVVDAGHGGDDFGALGAHSQEKFFNLDIARRVRSNLMARGANVLMTRDGDYFVTLQGRVDFANSRKADLFFSVHINSFHASSSGTATYFYTTPSLVLAQEVNKELVKATGLKDRGIYQERLFVTRKTLMPSVLTECAFISNPTEEALLLKPQWRDRVAQGMAQGIANYVKHYMHQPSIAG